MARTARIVDSSGGYYHVISRGNNKAVIFHDALDFTSFLAVVSAARASIPFKLHNFVLMTNHYHLLIEMPENRGAELRIVMKMINQSYSSHYRKRYRFVGRIWQGRYKSFIIMTDAYLQSCGTYIEANPVRAGIVAVPSSYPWSSASNGERGLSPRNRKSPHSEGSYAQS